MCLASGETYSFRVRSTNGIGDSDWAEVNGTTDSARPPDEVPNFRVTNVTSIGTATPLGAISLYTLEWDEAPDNGSPIIRYELEERVAHLTNIITKDPTEFKQVIRVFQHAPVVIKLRAVNAVGNGEWSPSHLLWYRLGD